MREIALAYAARGWPVLPLEIGGKAPIAKLVPHGVAHATTDPEPIRYWWTRAKAANIGIATRDFLVVDPDLRNGGLASREALVAQYGPFPLTPTARTGGGGMHYVFKRPAVPLLGKLAPGVDLVHGARRYFVAAPSIHASGRQYEWLTPPTTPLADVPAWVLELARRPEVVQARAASRAFDGAESSSQRIARGRRYAERMEPAVSGRHGHDATIIACAKMVRVVGLNADEAFEALADWNRRCDPPWSESQLRRKIDHAIARAERRSA